MNSGTRLGPYEIVSPLGAGGMGEVYKARDTRLDRSVAVKILPAEFAQNAQLRLRLEREAKAISQMTHPNICTLYDVGDGYLVMELLEGESLADRIARGPLPMPDVLRYGAQIADALGQAHRAGIVHRDLKPGNVMITKTGAKLLDFGLAKSATHVVELDGATQQKALTAEGAILGTFQYMAPEQLEGEDADARTDIFTLGTVLYEMATGKRAFEGKTRTSLIASIVSGTPRAISVLQPVTPPAFEHVVNKCVEKDRDTRWQSAADIAEELRWIASTGNQETAVHTARPRWRNALIVNAIIAAIAVAATWAVIQARRQPPRIISAAITPPDKAAFAFDAQSGPMVLSRDGTRVVFAAKSDSGTALWVRALSSSAAQPLLGTEGATFPFWSPDGRYIGFFANGKLKKIDANGGPAEALCDIVGSLVRGGAWNREGVIVFTPGIRDGLSRISASGGTPAPVTKLDRAAGEFSHRYPSFLPDGQHFLYAALNSISLFSQTRIFVGSLDGKPPKYLLTASSGAIYIPQGYLLFVRDRTLMAQRFDVKRLALSGDAQPIVENVQYFDSSADALFDASDDGTLAYQTSASGRATQMAWFDLTGKEISKIGEPAIIDGPRPSHRLDRVVYAVTEPSLDGGDLWMFDLARNAPARFTFDRFVKGPAVWSPDDKWIAYTQGKSFDAILMKSADGVSQPQVIASSAAAKMVTDWSPSGRYIMFQATDPRSRTSWDLWYLDVRSRKISPFLQMPYAETQGAFSPDEKWVAYVSDETGVPQVYVQPFPAGDSKWQVSTAGGIQPEWSADGKQIVFRANPGKLWVCDIETQPMFRVSTPRALGVSVAGSSMPAAHAWTMTPDGRRVIVNERLHDDTAVPVTVVTNFTERLR